MVTVGQLAKRVGTPHWRVAYVIRTRGIRPQGWVGATRVFSDDDGRRIEAEIRRLDSVRCDAPNATVRA